MNFLKKILSGKSRFGRTKARPYKPVLSPLTSYLSPLTSHLCKQLLHLG